MARINNSAGEATTGQLLRRLFRGYIRKHIGTLSIAMAAMAIVAATTAS